MDSQLSNKLYESFPDLYRERNAPLESSKMGWGFQCGDGWYKIIYEMSKRIKKRSPEGEYAAAITQVSKNEDGTLHVEARNLTPPVADAISAAQEKSRLTCELCSYSPAFRRTDSGELEGFIACGRCSKSVGGGKSRTAAARPQKPRLVADVCVVKR